jgi:CheY-like chemotaxis protein
MLVLGTRKNMISKNKKKSIFFIEDDASIREICVFVLEQYGYQVQVAKNGIEAQNLLQKLKTLPNLIILDVSMPVMNGLKFREWQLECLRISQVPTIIMSADTDIKKISQTMRADGFLKKPFDIEDLIFVIEKLIK